MDGAVIFSKVDLKRAYHQLAVIEEDRHKTNIHTTLGIFQFNRVPYGLKNAAGAF